MDGFWWLYDRIIYCGYNNEYRNQREFQRILMKNRKTILDAHIMGMTLYATRDKVAPHTIRPCEIDGIRKRQYRTKLLNQSGECCHARQYHHTNYRFRIVISAFV